jgi:crossover junction endodeoxyribonuclease RuvC
MSLVLGVDPGSLRLGWGLIRVEGSRLEHVAHGTLITPRGKELPARLAFLHRELSAVLDQHRPATVGLEKVFTGRNVKAALTLGQARGIILLALGERELPLAEYAPTEVKAAVGGHGQASKEQLAHMVSRILATSLEGESADATDALAIAICHAHAQRHRRLVAKAQRER